MKGIDVYKGQGDIDFAKVKADGFDFVIIQAGYGKYAKQKDMLFERNYTNAKRNGMHVGAYWYSYATSAADALQEAKVFVEIIKGKQFDMPVAFDIEERSQASLSASVVGDIIDTFCKYVEAAGLSVIRFPYLGIFQRQQCSERLDIISVT